jgi:peptidoglycan hydrolase-like protein with peptidoglycan-binding domain
VVLWSAVVLVVVAAAGSVTILLRTPRAAAPPTPPAVATAPVVRTSLVESETVDGMLNYGQADPLVNRIAGTLTSVPPTGSTVARGQALYRVDDLPVILFYGPVSAYRALQPGALGDDVRQVEQNLAGLGYTGFTVDTRYTASTAVAVRRWQRDLGLPQTGTVDLGRVVFSAGPVRVQHLSLRAGQPANPDGPVFDYTGTTRVVIADLEVTKRQLARVGAAVTVNLPNQNQVAGVVAGIGTVASAQTPDSSGGSGQSGQSGQTGGPGQQNTPTVPVTVTLADQGPLGDLDEAPVTVALTSQRRDGVLAVPVTALLALREGGYGVQVVNGSSTSVAAVRTGLFAGGLVEVSGDGLAEGVRVGVASA